MWVGTYVFPQRHLCTFVMYNVLCLREEGVKLAILTDNFPSQNINYCLNEAISQLKKLSTTYPGLKTYSGAKFTADAPLLTAFTVF